MPIPIHPGHAGLSRPPRKILLIRLKGIGDVILSTPLLRALKKSFPGVQVHFLTRPAAAPILRHNPFVDKVWVHPGKNEPLGRLPGFLKGLWSEHYDWTLDLAAEPRSAWLTLATGAPLRAGYAFRLRKWAFNYVIPKNQVRKYQAEVNLDILRALGVPDDGNQTQIFLGPEEIEWAQKAWGLPEWKGQRVKVGINPTGTWSSKRWPTGYWRTLIGRIGADWGVKPVLVGGPDDGEILREVGSGLEEKILRMPATTLLQAAAFITGLDLIIGNDGTPQHMAQAFGVKSLTLCGPHWGLGWIKAGDPRHRYLQHFLDCGPCDRNVCPFPATGGGAHAHQECLWKIPPEKVLQTASEMLDLP